MTIQEIENNLHAQRKLIYQLNDLLSLTIEVLSRSSPFDNLQKDIHKEYEQLKTEIYSITGHVNVDKYNLKTK